MSTLITLAFETLYPGKPFSYEAKLIYSGKFKGFNANARLSRNQLTFKLAKQWRPVSNDIKIGLLQELMVKLFKQKAQTINMDLYSYFLKSIDKSLPVTKTEPLLETVFHKINAEYFYGLMDKPNLQWGSMSTTTLGHYDFGTDCITISTIFHPERCDDQTLLEYVMYHEMLHKHHKFHSHAGRTRAHTTAFRNDESRFPNQVMVEKRMNQHAAKHRVKKRFLGWF